MTFATHGIEAFTDAVASQSVTPSGGAVAAVVGALGASLCEMGCLHAGTDADLSDTGRALAEHRARLLALADEDAAAVDELQDAIRRDDGDAAVASAAKRATDVPLETATESLAVLEVTPAIVEAGSRNAAPDVATGGYLAYATCRASVVVVRANLETIEDAAYVAEVATTATDLEAAATAALERVEERLAPDT